MSHNHINIENKKDCSGCNACGDNCPTNAIKFKNDDEGFWYPHVDEEICINCGLCIKTCPIINIDKIKRNDINVSICYAAENKNLEVVFDSTSGGLFSVFAEKFYRENGYVGGAVFSDDCKSVSHYISSDKKDLPRLRSSKYLQSSLEGFYIEVKKILEKGKKVAVCGCPCQISAFKTFLKKDYENLLLIDFICLGINSPLIWKKYIDSFEERYGSPVVYAKAKSKEYGWRNLTQKVILRDGRVKYETKNQSNFTRGYIGTHAYIRPSCYDCVFRGFPRISDVTLADFWGIEKFDKKLEKDLGTSLVMVNSLKGKKWFDRIENRINYFEVPFKDSIIGNPALVKSPTIPLINREQFFKDVNDFTFNELAEKYEFFPKNSNISKLKRNIKLTLSVGKRFLRGLSHVNSSIRSIRNNSIKSIINNKYISFSPHSYCEISKRSTLRIEGRLRLGHGVYKKNKDITKLLVSDNAILNVKNSFNIGYGSDIEILKNGELTICGKGGTNVNFTCICANKIHIGEGVMIGRCVTIRDNNGGHYINRAGYKVSNPVIIGNKVWLCEGCTIMPGVKIGDGAIIGAKSFVTSNVPPYTMVSGNPAKIVDEDILWKY